MKKRKELCQRNRKNCGMGTVEMILIIVENQRHPNLMCFV